MVLETIRALFGSLPAAAGPLFSASPTSEDWKDVKMRARAWALMSSKAKQAAVFIPGLQVRQESGLFYVVPHVQQQLCLLADINLSKSFQFTLVNSPSCALQSEAGATLMGLVGAAVTTALQSGSAPSVCAGCRSAGAEPSFPNSISLPFFSQRSMLSFCKQSREIVSHNHPPDCPWCRGDD